MPAALARLFPSPMLSTAVLGLGLVLPQQAGVAQVLLAAVLAVLVPLGARRLERGFARIGALWPVPWLAAVIVYDIVHANLVAARLVFDPRARAQPGWIWMPLESDNLHVATGMAILITLTPGTVSVELSEDRRHLLVHVLDLRDPQAAISELKQRYEAPLRALFP